MILKAFGETIVDVLTTNPALKDIPSASAILDVSNYCFQALTFGKDSDGFSYHAHSIKSLSADIYNDGIVKVTRYNSLDPSSYHTSATHLQFSSTYKSVPNYPTVYDARLERSSLNYPIEVENDLGHYQNFSLQGNTSWNILSPYPPASGSTYQLLDSSGGVVLSGSMSSVYNTHNLIDKDGYITFTSANGIVASSIPWIQAGCKVLASSSISSTPEITISVCPQLGDLVGLSLFGGINHIGIYTLDIKQMLKDGNRPPFRWAPLNNIKKYKLVAKVTFWDDLLHHNDVLDIEGNGPVSGLKYLLEQGVTELDPANNKGPVYNLRLKFV
jgi:hypothetical protein